MKTPTLFHHKAPLVSTVILLALAYSLPQAAPAEAGGGDGSEGEQVSDRFSRRAQWIHKQRAYPLEEIPAGARSRALRQIENAKTGEASVVSGSGGLRWFNIGPAPIRAGQVANTGRLAAVAVDPADSDHWLVGAAQGGVWETWNGGTSWAPRTDDQASLAMGAITFAPSQPEIVYAGTGEANFSAVSYVGAGLLKSRNRGTNWFLLAADRFALTAFSEIRVHSTLPDLLMAATVRGIQGPVSSGTNMPPQAPPRGVFKSSDGGTNWSQKLWGEATDLEIDPTNFGRQYAALGEIYGAPTNGVFRSLAAGDSWTRVNGPWEALLNPTDMGRIELAIAPSDPNTLYVSVSRKRGVSGAALLGIWRTDNAWNPTPSWSLITTSSAPDTDGSEAAIWYYHDLIVHPTNPSVLHFAGFSLWKYALNNWVDIRPNSVHVDMHTLAWRPVSNGYRLLVGGDGGLWSVGEDSSGWQNHNQGLSISQFYEGSVHPTNSDMAIGGTQDNGTELFSGAKEWDRIDCCDGADNAISASHPDQHWAVSFQTYFGINIRRTKDGGQNIHKASSGISSANAPFLVRFEKHPANDDLFIAGTVNLWKCVNFFTATTPSWSANGPVLMKATGEPAEISALAFAPSDASGLTYAYGTEVGHLRITTNGGTDWADLDPAGAVPGRYITDLAFDPSDPNVLYVTLSGFDEGTPGAPGHVFRTADALTAAGAPSWTNISPPVNLPHNTIAVNPVWPSQVYVGTDLGVWVTTDSGLSWAHMGPSSGMPNVAVFELQMNSHGAVMAFTHGRGAFALRLDIPIIHEVACPLPCQLGWINPLDLVTIDLPLRSIITVDTVDLVARLRPTAQVTPKSGPQSYGALPVDGQPVSKSFSLQVSAEPGGGAWPGGPGLQCGDVIQAIFDLEDQGVALGSVAVPFRLGRPNPLLSLNLEDVTPPELPEDWRAEVSDGVSPWSTTTNHPPNSLPGSDPDRVNDPPGPGAEGDNIALFAPAPDVLRENLLYSAPIPIRRAFAELSFRHSFDFQPDRDGGVLEIAIGDNPFVDMERALGRFTDNGYNAVLDGETPLLGRRAWSGNSGGYLTTRVRLPETVTGQTIRLCWRCATDDREGGGGWYVDDVELIEFECTNPVSNPLIVRPRFVGDGFAFSFDTVPERTYAIEGKVSLEEPVWQAQQTLLGDGSTKTVTVSIAPGAPRFFRFQVE